MSFYPQPNNYQCGPFALKYALVMLGIFKEEDQIGISAGSTWWGGTDEIALERAAKKYGCKMKHFQSSNPNHARQALNINLKKKLPCILSVKNWEHWLTVINYSKGKYIAVDSSQDDVINILNSKQLLKKWRYYDEKDNITSYDGYVIVPKFKTYTKAKFTLKRARELMYEKNKDLAKKWDTYFNDVTSIGKPRTKLTVNYITFSEFLRRNQKNLVNKVADWHGNPKYSELAKLLMNMQFVADAYDIIIPTEDEKKALIDISSILMMYSCGKYGMESLY
ncbi:cysteine peptidase family C39 domain-containing protein [Bacteroidota bacterium]